MPQSTNIQIAASTVDSVPEVGMGATELLAYDRRAGTIIDVSYDKQKLTFQRDRAIRIDNNGASGDQVYRYPRNPRAHKRAYTLRDNGQWCLVGTATGRAVLAIGHRCQYHDDRY